MQVNCLICEKELTIENGVLCNGGYMHLEFCYGSTLDQCHDLEGGNMHSTYDQELQTHRLLSCQNIEAYICDDCFTKKYKLCRGFNTVITKNRIEVS